MKLVRGKIDTEGYQWHININEQINESLKEGLENQLNNLSQLPYVYFTFGGDTRELMVEVMDERFTSGNPLVFQESFSEVVTHLVELYTHSDRTIKEEIPRVIELRDALQKEVEYLNRCIECSYNERPMP